MNTDHTPSHDQPQAWDDEDQMTFDFYLDRARLSTFLTAWLTLDTEEARLREERRILKEDYKDAFPMRAVMAALKIVHTQEALATHPKEPLAREPLAALCRLIETHYGRLEAEMLDIAQEAIQVAQGGSQDG